MLLVFLSLSAAERSLSSTRSAELILNRLKEVCLISSRAGLQSNIIFAVHCSNVAISTFNITLKMGVALKIKDIKPIYGILFLCPVHSPRVL